MVIAIGILSYLVGIGTGVLLVHFHIRQRVLGVEQNLFASMGNVKKDMTNLKARVEAAEKQLSGSLVKYIGGQGNA